MTKFYIEEPEMPDFNKPVRQPDAQTRFYDTREEAQAESDRLGTLSEIYFCVWEINIQ